MAKPLAPIPFPLLDDLRHRVIGWVDGGRTGTAIRQMKQAKTEISRVKGSRRHQKMAEFLQNAIAAMENGETNGARYILLTAIATFGWVSPAGFKPEDAEEDTESSVRTRTS